MSPSQDQSGRGRFAVLDGMRGLAAVLVILDHVGSPLLMGLTPHRYMAVDFFFALSGFVLAHVYGPRLNQGLSFGSFMRTRLIRLYPLYLAGTLMGASLALLLIWKGWGPDASYLQWVGTLLFSVSYLPAPPGISIEANEPFPFDRPAWSLFFELVVNVVFALIATRLSLRWLLAILAAGAAGLLAVVIGAGQIDAGFQWVNFPGGFARVGYAFFAGVLVYRLHNWVRLPTPPAWLMFALLLGAFMVPVSGVGLQVWQFFAATIAFPVLILFAARARVSGGAERVCLIAGTLSYGFYVLQLPVRDWVMLALDVLAPGLELPGVANVAIVVMATLAMASLLHVVYDLPLRRWLARRFPAR